MRAEGRLTSTRTDAFTLFGGGSGVGWGLLIVYTNQSKSTYIKKENNDNNLRQYNSPVTTVSQMASHGQSPPRWELDSTESQANRLFCFYGSATLLCNTERIVKLGNRYF